MDWVLKESAWDFTNMPVENNHDPRLATLIGSNNLCPDNNNNNNNRGSFSVDLKLGRIGDNMGDDFRKIEKYPSNNNSSNSGSSKRTKAVSGTQNVTCLVDGCVDDLRGCREYHRRHRVCERHSKTPVVTIGGYEKRFCQQCSRFQSVADFDEEKRSCRKRLDGHNRRRRKPQPEAFYTDHGSLFSNHQGTRLLQFGGLESYATNAFPTWPSAPTNSLLPNHSNLFPSSSANIHNAAAAANKRFPFLLTNNPEISNNYQAVPEVTIHPRLAHSTPFANVNPHRVHSLLSSSPRPTQNSAFGGTHQQISPAHQYFRSPALIPQANNYQNSYNNDNDTTMVSLSPDNLLEKGASQVFPFSWK